MKHRIWYAIVAMLCCISMLLPLSGCDHDSGTSGTTSRSDTTTTPDHVQNIPNGSGNSNDQGGANDPGTNDMGSVEELGGVVIGKGIILVGQNENWWIGNFDTGISTTEKNTKAPTVGENGNWWIGETDMNVTAEGNVPSVSENGTWKLGSTDTAVSASGTNGGDDVGMLYFYIDGSKHLFVILPDGTAKDAGLLCMHQLVEIPGKEPSCTEAGYTESFRCVLCERTVIERETIPDLGGKHIPEIDHGVPATCQSPGLSEGSHCSVCEKVLLEQKELPKTIHNYVNGTCTVCMAPMNDTSSGYPLPTKVDLERYEYNAYVRSDKSGNGAFYCEDFWVDSEFGAYDILSFAVVQRNAKIEKDFNCSIHMIESKLASQYTEMLAFYNTDMGYDLAILVGIDAATCATDGLLSNLKSAANSKNLLLSHSAFDQNSIKSFTMGNALYYLSGDMNISALDNTMATLFNTALFAKLQDQILDELGDRYSDPYQMVAEGYWTLENMMKIANVAVHDHRNDDGALRFDKGDTIGYYEYLTSPLYYFYGSGMRITENIGGKMIFSITDVEAETAYDQLFSRMNVNMNAQIPRGGGSERGLNFQSGAVLFTDYLLWDVRRVLYTAENEVPYGILPIPTLEEKTDYHSVVYFQNCAHLWSIPSGSANANNAALMMYVMAAYSGMPNSVMDAYYVKTLRMEVCRDNGSRNSLDIIRGTLEYDIALLYDWGEFSNLLLGAGTEYYSKYDTYVSASSMAGAEKRLEETISQFTQYA